MDTRNPKGSDKKLGDVIEQIGFGYAQLRIAFISGGVWLADGAELLLIGTVTRAVSDEWHMAAWQRGFVVSVVFVGIFIGNGIGGPLSDSKGRRALMLYSFLGIAVFSILSAMTTSFWCLSAVRLLVGISFGIGQPANKVLTSEVAPSKWRIAMNSVSQLLFIVGEFYSASLIYTQDPTMRNLHWRWLLILGALPSVICGLLAYMYLPDSPSFLAAHGDYVGAQKVLEKMRCDNGAGPVALDFHAEPPKDEEQESSFNNAMSSIKLLYSPTLLYSTLTVMLSCFTCNVLYYGSLYAFPQLLAEADTGVSAAMGLMIGAGWEVPGVLLAAMCGMAWRRIPAMAVYLVLTSISLALFIIGVSDIEINKSLYNMGIHGISFADGVSISHWLTQCGYAGIKCFPIIGFTVVYQYATEIYPTKARTTGTAACIAGGRAGGILAPTIFEELYDNTGSYVMFFYLMLACCAINFVLVLFLPFETYGKQLQEHMDEARPLTDRKSVV